MDYLGRCLPDESELPGFFANKAGVLLEGGDSLFVDNAEGFIRLNLAMPRSIIEKGLRHMTEASETENKIITVNDSIRAVVYLCNCNQSENEHMQGIENVKGVFDGLAVGALTAVIQPYENEGEQSKALLREIEAEPEQRNGHDQTADKLKVYEGKADKLPQA